MHWRKDVQNMRWKLICLDVDGTLLDDRKIILPEVKMALRKAAEGGVYVALASGRMPAALLPIERELGISCIKACNAGAYILRGDQCIGEQYLSTATMMEVYREIAVVMNTPLWIFRREDWFVTEVDEFVRREDETIWQRAKRAEIQELGKQWKGENGPSKLLFAASPEKIQAISRYIKKRSWPDISAARSADNFLEIFPRHADKGWALGMICRNLQIDLKDTVAFGDQELDLPMILAAGTGIAMGNAIPLLKEKADFVTKSNNEAGVAYALERYL